MKNPKTIAGLAVLAVLVIALGIVIARLVPTIGETRLEMSLTPTPEPEWPLSVMMITPDPNEPTAEPVLRKGSKGQAVKDLQSRLYNLGYYKGEIDGKYGDGTRDAVRLFQTNNGLGTDGIVGAETREILFSAEAKPYVPPKEETETGAAEEETLSTGKE